MGDIDADIARELAIGQRSDHEYATLKMAQILELSKGPRATERKRLQRICFACYMVIGTTAKALHGRFWVIWCKAHARLEDCDA